MNEFDGDARVMEFDLLDALDALAAAIVLEKTGFDDLVDSDSGSTVLLCLADIREVKLNSDDASYALEEILRLFGPDVRLQYQASYDQTIESLKRLALPEEGGDG